MLCHRKWIGVRESGGTPVDTTLAAKASAKFGKLLSMLGLADIAVEAEVSASGRLSFAKEVLMKFTPAQKLKALLLKLHVDGKLAILTDDSTTGDIPQEGTPTFFSARLRTNFERRPESSIIKTKAAILTGKICSLPIEVEASLAYMESEGAWRRWDHARKMVGFGTLIGPAEDTTTVEFDPIILAYAQPM